MNSEELILILIVILGMASVGVGLFLNFRSEHNERVNKSTDLKDLGKLMKSKAATVGQRVAPEKTEVKIEPRSSFSVLEPPRHLPPNNSNDLDEINSLELYYYERWFKYAGELPEELEYVTDPFGRFSTSASDGFSYDTPSLFWLRVCEGANGSEVLWKLVDVCDRALKKNDGEAAENSLMRVNIVVLLWRKGAEDIVEDTQLIGECRRLGIVPVLWISQNRDCVLDLSTGEICKQGFFTHPCGVDMSGDSTDYSLGSLGDMMRCCRREEFFSDKPVPTPEQIFHDEQREDNG